MYDLSRRESDELLDDLIEELDSVYSQAESEMARKVEQYLQWFREEDERQLQRVLRGAISETEWQNWRVRKILEGRRWTAMLISLSNDLESTSAKAYSIINGFMPEAYAIGGNWTAYTIEHKLNVTANFTLYNAEAIERLIREKPNLLPKPQRNIPKEQIWNKKHMTSAVMQSILQGERLPQLAKRLARVTDMNRTSAIRNARTMMGSAENGGINDQQHRAEDLGIAIQKTWMATLDYRVRDSHRKLDGETVKLDEKFSNGLLFPCDPNGVPREVYNCRCRLVSSFPEQNLNDFERNSKLGKMSYSEWKKARGIEPDFKATRNRENDKGMYKEYCELLGKNMPKSFKEFQRIKYNDAGQWKQMKKAARITRNRKRKEQGNE